MSNFSLSNHRKSQFAPLKTLKKAPIVSRPTSDQKNMLKPKLEEAAAKIRENPKVISFQPPIQYRGASLGKILQRLDIEKNKGIVQLNNYINKTRNRDKIDIRKMIRRSAEN